jgi:hypothetical protein
MEQYKVRKFGETSLLIPVGTNGFELLAKELVKKSKPISCFEGPLDKYGISDGNVFYRIQLYALYEEEIYRLVDSINDSLIHYKTI